MKKTGRKQEVCTKLHWKSSKKETNIEGICSSNTTQSLLEERMEPIPVAKRSKTWICGRSLAGVAGSNPKGEMDFYLLWVMDVFR